MLIEKLSPIRNERDSMFVDNEEESTKNCFEMTNGGGGGGGGEDLSIIEYGPGIVKKLRSRYQSLALRQYTARPSLRRSASLENVLDAVSAEELAATLESKISNGHHNHNDIPDNNEMMMTATNGRQTRPRNRFLPQNSLDSEDSRTSSPAPPAESQQKIAECQQNGKSGGTRGRTAGVHDATARRDRMRRARSVDALHRTKREEEILEKFKHVVLPKEEIVIIEVSKPQSNGHVFVENGSMNGTSGTNTGTEKRFPTRLLLTANNLRTSAGVLDQQTANRVRNLMISPEHELPPHDIVRETARIFERNQENLNRRIGQALRLSKSQSATGLGGGFGGSSPLQSPESPTPTQQQKSVMAQSTTSSAMQSQDKSFSTTAMANGPSSASSPHGQKQIGIIKPTLSSSNGTAPPGLINGNSVNNKSAASVTSANGSGNSVAPCPPETNRVRSPILSPIGFPNNKPLHLQNSQKPPLSPKPIFTSSPKVTVTEGKNKGTNNKAPSLAAEPSPSTSPILIIDNNRDTVNQRSLSPFKSESPIPRVKSPTLPQQKTTTAAPGGTHNNDFIRSSSPLLVSEGKASPPLVDGDGGSGNKRLANQTVQQVQKTNNKTVVASSGNLQNGQQPVGSSDHHRQQVTKSSDQIPAPPPRSISPAARSTPTPEDTTTSSNSSSSSSKPVSQLRVHQKQKSSQQANGSMVFNFTSRKQVPDYIEDDGLRRSGRGDGATVEDSSLDKDSVDSKVIPTFEGANIIINGKSSIQKKPKSQKLSISFNEEATTTHEYPSESSFAIEEDPSENENSAPKKPNVVTGSSLGSYTPKTAGGTNAYQLGSSFSFDGSSASHNTKSKLSKQVEQDQENEFIEDYLKPNTESTTWSNEMSADILF